MFDRTLTEFLIVGVSSFVLTAILSRLIIPKLRAMHAGQHIRKEGPESHLSKEGTPMMGGIAFIFAILIVALGMVIYYAVKGEHNRYIPLGLTLALAVFNGMIGFLDDFRKLAKKENEGLKAWQKFALQVVAAIVYVVLLVQFGGIDTMLHIPFIDKSVELGIVYYIFAVILIVGVVNSVNLTDGLDGLASSITFVVAAFFAVVLFTVHSPIMENDGVKASISFVSAALIGATLGFLIYNHYPAKVFMGDTGSLFLGGMVVGSAFIIDEPMIIIVAGGMFIFEALSVMMQVGFFKITKKITGEGKRIFKMTPIHHHFEKSGWKEVKIVVVFSLVTVLLCAIAWAGLYF